MKTDWSGLGNTVEETSGDNVKSLTVNGKREKRVVPGGKKWTKDTFRLRDATALCILNGMCAQNYISLQNLGSSAVLDKSRHFWLV